MITSAAAIDVVREHDGGDNGDGEGQGQRRSLTYSILGGADTKLFEIDATAVLTFTSPPDYEYPGSAAGDNDYDVEVKVSDGDNSDMQTIVVRVTDVDDGIAPVITSAADFFVAENATVVGTVTASDADTPVASLSYSIAGGVDADLFAIDAKTGGLTFKEAPDFENPADDGGNNVYDVVVKVFDGLNATKQALAVTVTGGDDAPSVPELTLNQAAFKDGKLPEGPAAGTVIGVLSAIDQDGDQVTFLGDNDAFDIVKNEEGAWEVVVKDPSKIDYEAGSEITLTVTASGGAGPSSQGTFTFGIADVDEAATSVLFSNFVNLIAENTPVGADGIEIATLGAVDPDGGASTSQFEVLKEELGLLQGREGRQCRKAVLRRHAAGLRGEEPLRHRDQGVGGRRAEREPGLYAARQGRQRGADGGGVHERGDLDCGERGDPGRRREGRRLHRQGRCARHARSGCRRRKGQGRFRARRTPTNCGSSAPRELRGQGLYASTSCERRELGGSGTSTRRRRRWRSRTR